MEGLIAIEIDNRQARVWRFLLEAQVFDIRGGNAVLSFDKEGELRTIKKELFSYPNRDIVEPCLPSRK